MGAATPTLTTDQVIAFVLVDLVIIIAVARWMGALARKVGQPTVVGEIVAGILLGPTLLGRTLFAWDNPWSFLNCDAALAASNGSPSITTCVFPPQARSLLGVIGQIALVLFMFLVGLGLDWDLLRGKGRGIAAVSLGAVAVPVALGFVVGPVLYNGDFVGGFGTANQPSKLGFTLIIAAMLSVTAFPVMAHILREKGLISTAMGAVGVASAAVVTVLMFVVVAVAASVASDEGAAALTRKIVLIALYVFGVLLLARRVIAPLGRLYEERGSMTTGIFSVILNLLFLSAFLAHVVGVNVIVGGFLLGAVLPARSALLRDFATRLADITIIVLLPVYLAFSGLNTDFTTLGLSMVGGLALFVVAGIVGKWLGSMVFARLGGLGWHEGNLLGILMNCRGLLVLVVGLIGFQRGLISAPMQVGGVVMALVTTMMTGPLFDAFSKPVASSDDDEARAAAPEDAVSDRPGPPLDADRIAPAT